MFRNSNYNRWSLPVIVAILTIWSIDLHGAERDSIPPVSYSYGLTFETGFDNREYRPVSPSPSQTIFGARVVPSVGVILQSNGLKHSATVGADVLREFGQSSGENTEGYRLKAVQFYYGMKGQFGKTVFTMTTGIFPKGFGKEYPSSFVSDSLRFYDRNYEGLLMTFSRPESYFEIGCDWIGMYERSSRERFMIFSQGEAKVKGLMTVGYYATMFHYACSQEVAGVVDNILLNPWVGFDVSEKVPLTKAIFKIGWLQAAQNDRRNIGRFTFPGGAQVNVELTKWNFGLKNEFFYGRDLMPYYDKTDEAGNKYGSSLYYGDPFYHSVQGGHGLYDRAEIFYEPGIADFLRLRISLIAHFGKEYMGWQQCFSLIFDMKRR